MVTVHDRSAANARVRIKCVFQHDERCVIRLDRAVDLIMLSGTTLAASFDVGAVPDGCRRTASCSPTFFFFWEANGFSL